MKHSGNQDAAAAKVMDQAYAEMHDTRYDWLRRHTSRRVLVIATLLSAVAFCVGLIADMDVLFAAGLLAYLICVFLGRRAVRLIVDLPDECLDERQRLMRNEVYRDAYIWLGALAAIVWLGVLFAYGFLELPVERAHVYGASFTIFALVFSLPTLVYAWNVQEI